MSRDVTVPKKLRILIPIESRVLDFAYEKVGSVSRIWFRFIRWVFRCVILICF